MANNSLEIKVIFDKTKSTSKNETRKEKLKNVVNSGSVEKKEDSKQKKLDEKMNNATKAMAIGVVKNIATDIIDAGINSLDMFDMKMEQQRIHNILSITNRGLNAALTIATGATLGGPVGAIVAGVGVAMTELINGVQRNMQWLNKQQIFDIETQRQSTRLGEVTTSSGRHIKL